METIPRRTFLKKTSQACLGGCLLMSAGGLQAAAHFFPGDKKPDPHKMNYCGYTCPEGCEFKKATLTNDVELKKKAYEAWKIQERYQIPFEADKIFCFGCKNTGQPDGVVSANCTVRSCAIEKNFEACIQCNELPTCSKDLWSRFPEFHKQVIDARSKYMES